MDPLSVTASIIAILQLTTNIVKYLNDVKDAPKERARVAIEATNLSSLLISLSYQVEEGKSNEAWYYQVNSLGARDGPLDRYKDALEKIQRKVLDGNGKRQAKIANALVWKFGKEEIASILSIIAHLKSLFQITLEMDHFKLSQEMKRCMETIQTGNEAMSNEVGFIRDQMPVLHDGVDKLQLGVDGFQREQDHQKHYIVTERISSTRFPAQQYDLIGRRQAGTAQWFLKSPKFAKWLDGPSETLFCPGIPGAGKTMIAAITIDHLTKTRENSAVGVAYLYCNYNAQADQTTVSLLAAILQQLVQGRPSIAELLSDLYARHYQKRTRPSCEEILYAIKSVVKSLTTVYTVVDALDECSDQGGSRSELLAKLRDLQKEEDLRLLFTSRYIPDIENEFRLVPILEVRANVADVKRFVKDQIPRLPRCIKRDAELQGRVEDKIIEAADGMFLLARFHVDSLLDKRTKSKVLSSLEKLRQGLKTLNEAYDQAIERVEAQLPEDSELAKKVLSWITYVQRRLTSNELRHALAINPGNEDFDEENVLDVQDIISVCTGLVTVDEESNIIRFVHYTTQEYFEQIRDDWNPAAPQKNASTCLTYLSFNRFSDGSCPNIRDLEQRQEENWFLDYASRYWHEHARPVQEQLYELSSRFLHDMILIFTVLQTTSVSKYE